MTADYPLAVQKMFSTVPKLLTTTPIFKLTVTMVVKAAKVSRGSFYSCLLYTYPIPRDS